MTHQHLIKWGKDAFESGLSLEHIENYLLRRGMKRHEALKALHEITSFEHKLHKKIKRLRLFVVIPISILLIIAVIMMLYFGGVIKIG